MDGPKFSLVETIFLGFIAALIDIVSFFADFLAGIGGFFIQTASWFLFVFIFSMKGATATASLARRFVVPVAVQLLPFIPTQLATLLFSIYMENHPEKFGILQVATKVSKMNVQNLKNIKDAKGTLAAAKEGYREYRKAA